MKNNNFLSLPFFVLFFVCCWRWGQDYWWSKWSVGLAVCAIIIGIRFSKILKCKFFGAAVAWIILSGLFTFSWRDNMYQRFFSPDDLNAIYYTSAYGLCCALILFLSCSSLTAKIAGQIVDAFSCLCVISSTLIIVQFLRGKTDSFHTGGFFDQGSMEGIFIAITYPLFAFRPTVNLNDWRPSAFGRWFGLYGILSPLFAVLILCGPARASQPIGVMFVVFCVWIFREPYKFHWGGKEIFIPVQYKSLMILFLISVTGAVCLKINPEFLSDSDRFPTYKMNIKFLLDRPIANIVGTGTGTYEKIGPSLQKAMNIMPGPEKFLWAHSDWLQIWFENGLIGLFLVIGTGCVAFLRAIKSKDRWWAGVSLAGYGAGMVFNFPCHLAVHAFLGIFLLVLCLYE